MNENPYMICIVWEFPSGNQKLTIEHIEQENESINLNMVL